MAGFTLCKGDVGKGGFWDGASDMRKQETAAVILAAGKGTRMKSALHKVLHPIGGQPMIAHLLDMLDQVNVHHRVMVVGAGREQVEHSVSDRHVRIALQEPQLGTGHAVTAAMPEVPRTIDNVLVLYGDTPLITPEIVTSMLDARDALLADGSRPAIVVLGFRPSDPGVYGRLVADDQGRLQRIVEYKDANADERAVTLCNSGVMVFDGALLPTLLSKIGNDNAKSEYYLTDAVTIARELGREAVVVEANADALVGVNDRTDLAHVESLFQQRTRAEMMERGVTMTAPETVFFSYDTVLGRDVLVEPHVVFGSGVRVADGAHIRAFSHLEGADVAEGAVVGPYARLRPGAVIGKDAKVGNFVEIKQATLESGAKVSHLSYIGDAHVGAGANIGAGTITCNYDGFLKYRTEIGPGAFVGSNTALVAPVSIGPGAIIGAGSTITGNVKPDALSFTRAPQEHKEGWAQRFRDSKQRQKSTRKAAQAKRPDRERN